MDAGSTSTSPVDPRQVRRMVAGQFPQWADLPIEPVESAGTRHDIYRLGRELMVRLPRLEDAAGQAEKELRWLPVIAAEVPVPIPVPLALGEPAEGFPWPWSVYKWLSGQSADAMPLVDQRQLASRLAQFLTALHGVETTGGPESERGISLAERDSITHDAIAALRGVIDTDQASSIWAASLAVPAWAGPLVWTHGDLFPSNLLVEQGRLMAVIDFGDLGLSDPACDLLGAWSVLTAESRAVLRAEMTIDEPTWARGRGWAMSIAMVALRYYRDENPALSAAASRVVTEVFADVVRS